METAKKRASPDTEPLGSIPSSEHQPKRAKVEAFQVFGRSQERQEPLRDSDGSPHSKGCRRASSTKPTPSPGKSRTSIFSFRAQSVPLGGEREVPAIDLTSIPPSPRRSPHKDTVEVRRAPSLPPPDGNQMDVDDTSALLHFTNPTPVTPAVNTVFCYTVNFATPRESTTSRSGLALASPLSPLTPLPSPFMDRLPGMRSTLAKKANLLAQRSGMNADTDSPMPFMAASSKSHTTSSMDMPQPTSQATKRARAGGSDSEKGVAVGQGQAESSSTPDSTGGTHPRTATEPSSARSSLPSSKPRSTVIGAMKPKQGPSAPRGARRVTRSASMKEQRVKVERAEDQPTADVGRSVAAPAEIMADVAKSTSAMASKLKPPPSAHASSSTSNPKRDPNKLRQTSINMFIKAAPNTAGTSAALTGSSSSTSTNEECSSKPTPFSSPSKIPLPTSPAKRPSTGNVKPFPLSGSTETNGAAGSFRAAPGRSLATLSHALDKLVVPPPSRPNTSLGFVGTDGASDDDSTRGTGKGKGKAKDDTSLPSSSTARASKTFARPTASSLRRATTVTEIGATPAKRAAARSGAALGALGNRRGVIGIFGRVGDRASKKTSLPVVAGSPVKGSEVMDDQDVDDWGTGSHVQQPRLGLGAAANAEDDDIFTVQNKNPEQDAQMQDGSTKSLTNGSTRDNPDVEILSSVSVEKGKQRAVSSSTLNPASSALHALSESLSSLPHTPTPPKPRVVGTRTGLRSSTIVAGKDSPAQDGCGNTGPAGNDGTGVDNGMLNGSGSIKKSSLKILKRCAIFVDVRTEQGDDAGGLFVDMLRGLGAKIMGRLGQSCTHIVYKNGIPHTLARYRMLNDPKPFVVGIAWVVECAEKRAKVDEEKFKIDVDMINVAGGSGNHKRRRSMLPKHLIPASPGPDDDVPLHGSSEADEHDEGANGMDTSLSQDPDVSIRSREDDLPPLERARRRRSTLPGGQTRLVP